MLTCSVFSVYLIKYLPYLLVHAENNKNCFMTSHPPRVHIFAGTIKHFLGEILWQMLLFIVTELNTHTFLVSK